MNSCNDVVSIVKCEETRLSAPPNAVPDNDAAEMEQMLFTQKPFLVDTSSAKDLECGIWIFRGPSLQRYTIYYVDMEECIFVKCVIFAVVELCLV